MIDRTIREASPQDSLSHLTTPKCTYKYTKFRAIFPPNPLILRDMPGF
jgi:hypothetical protein